MDADAGANFDAYPNAGANLDAAADLYAKAGGYPAAAAYAPVIRYPQTPADGYAGSQRVDARSPPSGRCSV